MRKRIAGDATGEYLRRLIHDKNAHAVFRAYCKYGARRLEGIRIDPGGSRIGEGGSLVIALVYASDSRSAGTFYWFPRQINNQQRQITWVEIEESWWWSLIREIGRTLAFWR